MSDDNITESTEILEKKKQEEAEFVLKWQNAYEMVYPFVFHNR